MKDSPPAFTAGIPAVEEEEVKDDGSGSSDLEEGEIVELPAPPATISNRPPASRHYRKPPSSRAPPSRDVNYAFPADVEESYSKYRNPTMYPTPPLQQQPFPYYGSESAPR